MIPPEVGSVGIQSEQPQQMDGASKPLLGFLFIKLDSSNPSNRICLVLQAMVHHFWKLG